MPRRLHRRGQADALHPPRRVRRLRSLRTGVPGRGDLLRGRHARGVEGVLRRERALLRRDRFAGRCRQDGCDRRRSPDHRGPPTAEPGMSTVSARFPEFPWDTIVEAKARAAAHPDGLVDLSMGTPVDPTPDVIQKALADATNAPSYPTVLGPVALRQAAVDWLERRFGVTGLTADQVLTSIGSK